MKVYLCVRLHRLVVFLCNCVFSVFPLQNKVVASTFKGKKYGDNPQYILEELHEKCPSVRCYWLKDGKYEYPLPAWIHGVSKLVGKIYHTRTAKVIVDTHRFPLWMKKRKGQLFIETWHGGLGIKKLEADVPAFREKKELMEEVRHTSEIADLFISQSDHLSGIYRRAFGFKGTIFKCGYPKNDQLLCDQRLSRENVRRCLGLRDDAKIVLYAPTFRDYFYDEVDMSVYDIDFDCLKAKLEEKFGGEWKVVVRWHPLFATAIKEMNISLPSHVIDATSFPDMQELLGGCDVVVSDYSSCIFDAALLDIPCFTYATDFDAYKADRGVYYEMGELPFPYARNNEDLMENIKNYDHEAYLERWREFKERMGLYEPGNASVVISNIIINFIHNNILDLT